MPRELFKGMKSGEQESEGKEYTPPEEELVDSELVSKLLEHYTTERNDKGLIWTSSGILPWTAGDFRVLAEELESIIKDGGDKLQPQLLIESLTVLMGKCDEKRNLYPRTMYLTAVVQALYNLDYSSEFAIDVTNWFWDRWMIGHDLKGTPERPLTLNLHGDFRWCGIEAEHCNFTFHDNIESCGTHAENCTFSLMPDAVIKKYEAKPSKGNVVRILNDKGEVKIIPTLWWNLYHSLYHRLDQYLGEK